MVREGLKPTHQSFEGGYWSLPTDIGLVDTAENVFIKRLKRSGWDTNSDEIKNVQVAFREALINAMAHGNLNIKKSEDDRSSWFTLAERELALHSTDKIVKVVVKVSKERIYIQVRDQGEGFNPEDVPDPLQIENILKGSGRGIFLMQSYFDSVKYTKGGREVTMIKTRKQENVV